MIGEVSLGGVFVPTLLLLAMLAMAITAALTRLLGLFGVYRFLAYRAAVDLSLFVLTLGLLALLAPSFGYSL